MHDLTWCAAPAVPRIVAENGGRRSLSQVLVLAARGAVVLLWCVNLRDPTAALKIDLKRPLPRRLLSAADSCLPFGSRIVSRA